MAYKSLKDISNTNFLDKVLEEHGVDDEQLASLEEPVREARGMAECDRKSAILQHLITDEGRKELCDGITELMEKYDLVRIHYLGHAIASKVKSESVDELCKIGEQGFAFFSIIQGNFITRDYVRKGFDLLESVRTEIERLDNGSNSAIIIDILLENPNWISELLAKLVEADKNFLYAMPANTFPPKEQIEAEAKIIFGDEWTSGHSVRYYLQSVQKLEELKGVTPG
ncbi:MAG: hypothetical protein WA103_00530 [Minisyncoccales bacterium]